MMDSRTAVISDLLALLGKRKAVTNMLDKIDPGITKMGLLALLHLPHRLSH